VSTASEVGQGSECRKREAYVRQVESTRDPENTRAKWRYRAVFWQAPEECSFRFGMLRQQQAAAE
jgi:hypothetical protein